MKLFGRTSKHKRSYAQTVLPLAMVAFMIAMALLPLVQPSAADAKSDIKINNEVDLIDITPTPIVIKAPPGGIQVTPTKTPPILVDVDDDIDIDVDGPILVDPSETPVIIDSDIDLIETPVPTATTGDGTISINKHNCPAGYDGSQKSFYELAADCGGSGNGIGFLLSDGAQAVQSQTTGDVVPSGVEFTGVVAGPYSIVEQVPAGYEVPRVFCDSVDAGEGGSPASFGEENVEDGNQVFHVLQDGQYFYCDWFNFPTADAGDDTPVITLPGGSIFDVEGDNPVIDLPDCVDGKSTTIRLPAGVDLDLGRRQFTLVDGTRIELGDEIQQPDYLIEDRDSWAINFPVSLVVEIGDEGTDITIPVCDDIEETAATGSITISKMACPTDYDAYAADIYDLVLNCANPLDNIGFILRQGDQAFNFNKTNASGYAGFGNVPAGEVVIEEEVPAGFAEPIVYCQTNNPNVPAAGDTLALPVVDGNSVVVDLPEGGEVNCQWFNVPFSFENADDGSGTISIFKGECPNGFDTASADVFDFAFSCAEAMSDVTFLLSDGNGTIGSSTTDANGQAGFNDVPAIPVSIVEQVPVGFGEPVVFCSSNVPGDVEVGDTIQQTVLDGNQIFHLMAEGESLSCTWYNTPSEDGGTVVVHKYSCTADPGFSDSIDSHLLGEGCTPLNGVEFTLNYGIDTVLSGTTGDAFDGGVEWSGLPVGDVLVHENVPAGYEAGPVYCSSEFPGTPIPLGYDQPELVDGTISLNLGENEQVDCWWINIPTEDGTIRLIKYTCDAGYDLYAYGADPAEDCKHRTNGVEFTIDGPNGYSATGVTGNSGDKGKTIFAGLAPGDYQIHEIVPAGTEFVFVLTCEDNTNDLIQGYPLSVGSTLSLAVEPNSLIICRWYNVPSSEDFGAIHITKHACSTEYFVDATDCDIYELGADFSLSTKQGNQWLVAAEGTTNAAGVLSWSNLAPGEYQIDELNGEWCFAAADRTNANGDLIVAPGEITYVDVYNCGIINIVKKPTSFPNTGAGPTAVVEQEAHAPVSTAGGAVLDPRQWMGVLDGRLVEFLSEGERPVSIVAATVGIAARTETLEIIDGALQDPTTSDQVAWYKDTAKLGGEGNVVMAGHLNYWGDPEGVFFHLADLKTGDEIVVKGDRGTVYHYRVIWVEQVDVAGADLSEIASPTETPSLTLITCGGEWDEKAQEYNQRTVVRAELVSDAA